MNMRAASNVGMYAPLAGMASIVLETDARARGTRRTRLRLPDVRIPRFALSRAAVAPRA